MTFIVRFKRFCASFFFLRRCLPTHCHWIVVVVPYLRLLFRFYCFYCSFFSLESLPPFVRDSRRFLLDWLLHILETALSYWLSSFGNIMFRLKIFYKLYICRGHICDGVIADFVFVFSIVGCSIAVRCVFFFSFQRKLKKLKVVVIDIVVVLCRTWNQKWVLVPSKMKAWQTIRKGWVSNAFEKLITNIR